MRFGIDIGHNCPPDTGARGIKFEDNLTFDVGHRIISKLKALGHEIIECKPERAGNVKDSLSRRCDRANDTKVDLFVSIHFNAFNQRANGTEIFADSAQGRKAAKPVLDEIVKLGFFNRGIKNGSHLFVLRNTKMPGILIESCFIDSQKDMSLFNPEAIANAIVKGLTGQLPVVPIIPVPDEEDNIDTTVLRLQRALNRLKITDQDGKVLIEDNTIDVQTKKALEKFQNIAGLQITGIVGNTTWQAINQILAKRVIRPKHAGGPVMRYLQHRMGVEVDGVYGLQTEDAVKRFQRQNGLLADGIVGPISWQKLIS
jgi:N-acetylmuramoyl-L-alanine amidase